MLCFGEDYALTLQLVLEIKYTDLLPWHITLDLLIRGHLTPATDQNWVLGILRPSAIFNYLDLIWGRRSRDLHFHSHGASCFKVCLQPMTCIKQQNREMLGLKGAICKKSWFLSQIKTLPHWNDWVDPYHFPKAQSVFWGFGNETHKPTVLTNSTFKQQWLNSRNRWKQTWWNSKIKQIPEGFFCTDIVESHKKKKGDQRRLLGGRVCTLMTYSGEGPSWVLVTEELPQPDLTQRGQRWQQSIYYLAL